MFCDALLSQLCKQDNLMYGKPHLRISCPGTSFVCSSNRQGNSTEKTGVGEANCT
jgi:hypothetical protein